MNKNKYKIFLTIFIVLIVVTSIAGFVAFPSNVSNEQNNEQSKEKKYYNGIEFLRTNNRWNAILGNTQISIYSSPDSVRKERITNAKNYGLNQAQKVYISINPEDNLDRAMSEIGNLQLILRPRLVVSCYKDSEKCKSLLLRTCKEATSLNKVVIIKKENITSLNYNQNCLEIKGSESEIIKD